MISMLSSSNNAHCWFKTSFVSPGSNENEPWSSPRRVRLVPSFSCEQPLAGEPVVEVLHELGIAVEEPCWNTGIGSQHTLSRLAPSGVGHVRIDVGPKAILAWLNPIPERARARIGEAQTHDRFDAFETVLPRHREPERCTILLRQRLAVEPGGKEGQLVRRFLDREPFEVRPGIPCMALPGGNFWIGERVHFNVPRGREWAREIKESTHLESGPRDRHRPSFDAAVPVDALLERHAPQQSVDVNGHFLFDQSINVDRPRPDSKGLRRAGDALVRTEFVEIVVARRMSLGCKQPTSIHIASFRRRDSLRQLPPLLPSDQHGSSTPNRRNGNENCGRPAEEGPRRPLQHGCDNRVPEQWMEKSLNHRLD